MTTDQGARFIHCAAVTCFSFQKGTLRNIAAVIGLPAVVHSIEHTQLPKDFCFTRLLPAFDILFVKIELAAILRAAESAFTAIVFLAQMKSFR